MARFYVIPAIVIFVLSISSLGQGLAWERSFYQDILKSLHKDLREHYYDPSYRGVALDAELEKTRDQIKEAKTLEEMADLIARFLYQFDDSHLTFTPPPKSAYVDFGWNLQMVEDKAFVIDLDKTSDAYKKGIRPGDQVYMIEEYIPSRSEFSRVRYHLEVLQSKTSLTTIIIKPSGNKYRVTVQAKVITTGVFAPSNREIGLQRELLYAARTDQEFYDEIPGLCVWKMPAFAMTEIKTDKMAGKILDCGSLIFDLRGNGGGSHHSLVNLAAKFFDKDLLVGEIKRRKEKEPFVIKSATKRIFRGKLAVLIDSETASAAEIFARVVQMENRGTVLGDRSSGAVMQATQFLHSFGINPEAPYYVQITIADLIMRDGQRLEKTGVTPDETILPSPTDIANRLDPALSRAASLLGFKLSPEDAGRIYTKHVR